MVSFSALAMLALVLFFSCKKSDNVTLPAAPAFSFKQKNISLAEDIPMSSVKPDLTGGTINAFTVSPDLPKGIEINLTSGEITGTPSDTLLPTKYVVTATGPGGVAHDTLTISVGTVAFNYGATGIFTLQLNSTDLVTTPISPVIVAGNFSQFFVSPSPDSLTIKTGLKFNGQTGQISGAPTRLTSTTEVPTPVTFVITGITSANKAASTTINIYVNDKTPNFLYSYTGSFSVGTPVGTTLSPTVLSTSGAMRKYHLAPNSPALPAGLTIDSLSGKITGTPTAASNSTIIIRGMNTGGYQDVNLPLDVEATAVAPQVAYAMTWISGDIVDTLSRTSSGNTIYLTKPDLAVSGATPFIYLNPIVTGGQPGTFAVSPAFLSGAANEALTLSASSGVISGTPGQFTANSAPTKTITINNAAVGGVAGSFTMNIVSNAPFFTYNADGGKGVVLQNIFEFVQNQRIDTANGNFPGYSAAGLAPVGGTGVVSYTIYPNTASTPAFSSTGLTFNTTTGVISGKPTVNT
ncbi:MAG TPA: putative Ig domain-containing protein, partial [Chitinophagaceae bacterium]